MRRAFGQVADKRLPGDHRSFVRLHFAHEKDKRDNGQKHHSQQHFASGVIRGTGGRRQGVTLPEWAQMQPALGQPIQQQLAPA